MLMRPAKGSATVLKTKTKVPAPSISIRPLLAGDGLLGEQVEHAVVPRFFVATPQATGKGSPRVTAVFSAAATSSSPSSWPSSSAP